MQQFRDTPYFVTQTGDVYRTGKQKPLSPDIMQRGYRRVTLCIDGHTERFLLHRMVAEVYLQKLPHQTEVNHLDNDPSNNHVANLEWCTRSENTKHSHRQNRCANLIASKKASENKTAQTTNYFKNKMRDLFIEVTNVTPRNYVWFRCANCLTVLKRRIDSPALRQAVVLCRECK